MMAIVEFSCKTVRVFSGVRQRQVPYASTTSAMAFFTLHVSYLHVHVQIEASSTCHNLIALTT